MTTRISNSVFISEASEVLLRLFYTGQHPEQLTGFTQSIKPESFLLSLLLLLSEKVKEGYHFKVLGVDDNIKTDREETGLNGVHGIHLV
jgi:hypothetical protein